MLFFLAGPTAVRGRHLHHPHLPLPRGEYVISKLYFFLYFTYLWGFLAANSICILIHLFFFSWQSNHNDDTSATRPILLDELELEVHSFPSHAFSSPCVAMCFLFPLHVYLSLLLALTSTIFLSLPFLFFFFFRLNLSPFLFITPRVGKFLLLWACLWKASLMGKISWLRP